MFLSLKCNKTSKFYQYFKKNIVSPKLCLYPYFIYYWCVPNAVITFLLLLCYYSLYFTTLLSLFLFYGIHQSHTLAWWCYAMCTSSLLFSAFLVFFMIIIAENKPNKNNIIRGSPSSSSSSSKLPSSTLTLLKYKLTM